MAEREAEAADEQVKQVAEAFQAVHLPPEAFIHWPWPALSEVMGGIRPGTIGFLAAASGAGKTSFLMSAARRWCGQQKRVYYAGLESRPHVLRVQWACRSLGLDAGDVLSGHAARHMRDWPDVRRRIVGQIEMQDVDPIRFAPFRFLDITALRKMMQEAVDFEADVVIIDHIDHIDGGKGNTYESSLAAVKHMLTLAQDSDLRVLAATQTNLSGAGNDPLRFHRPVRREHVKYGNHKLEVADWALGLYRPLREGLEKRERLAFTEGRADLTAILQQGVTELNVMKHRLYGAREGKRIRLGFSKGEVLDQPQAASPPPPDGWWER